MKTKEVNVIGKIVIETTDWSAETLAQSINEIQSSVDGTQLKFAGDTFEADGTEYQIIVLSRKELTEGEMEAFIEEQILELSETEEEDEELKEEFFKQYMNEIAEVEGLTIKDCEYSWEMNKHLIEDLDDVDEVIEQIKLD